MLPLLLLGCAPQPPSQTHADSKARLLAGEAAPYEADFTLAGRLDELTADENMRRSEAWGIFSRVLKTVSIKGIAIPSWTTWYDASELEQILTQYLTIFEQKNPLIRAFRLHIDRHRSLPSFAGFGSWKAQLKKDRQLAGAFGLPRVLYNQTAAEHLIREYGEVASCAVQVRSACALREFPVGSVVLKASWERVLAGRVLGVYDTDGPSLRKRVHEGSWTNPDRDLLVEGVHGYQIELGRARFLLTGLHVISKELKDWYWSTLFYSDMPEEDLGGDRPVEIPPGFQDYKMCTVVGFEGEGNQTTWCSNPYLEKGPGNSRTNCIGCHQYAGLGLGTDGVLERGDLGLVKTRSAFPTDYLFSIADGPASLAQRFLEVKKAMNP